MNSPPHAKRIWYKGSLSKHRDVQLKNTELKKNILKLPLGKLR